MKALRYLLMVIAVLSVLSLSAQTHQYVTTQSHEQATYTVQVNPQMPVATMDYRHSDYMTSGSTLPQAALDGPTTTYDQGGTGKHGHIRKGADTGDTPPSDPHGPMEDPIGDAGWTLMLLACAYLIMRVMRKRSV